MGIYLGTATPTYYVGTATVSAMYLGSTQVYSANPITITAQPTNQTSSGGAATFSVAATAASGYTISYQWERQAISSVGSWSNVSGATSATLSLTGLASGTNDQDQYRCKLSTTGYNVTSSAAVLTVPNLISITAQPSSQTITGTTASFTCTATISGGGTASYAWYKQSFGVGGFYAMSNSTNVSGATSSTLSLSGLSQSSNNGDKYQCLVTYGSETPVYSLTATLTIGSVSSAWTSQNSQWLSAFPTSGAYGSGTTSSKFYRASITSGFDAASARVVSAGTVYIYAQQGAADFSLAIKKNGSAVFTGADSGNGFQGNIGTSLASPLSFSVAASDLITFGASGDNAYYSNLYIWWQ